MVTVRPPLPQPLQALQKMDMSSSNSYRQHSNSLVLSRLDNPKDKSGLLDVKKGMDSVGLKYCALIGQIVLLDKKIFAKWKKKQYCVLMWEDQQLRIYDNAQVSS